MDLTVPSWAMELYNDLLAQKPQAWLSIGSMVVYTGCVATVLYYLFCVRPKKSKTAEQRVDEEIDHNEEYKTMYNDLMKQKKADIIKAGTTEKYSFSQTDEEIDFILLNKVQVFPSGIEWNKKELKVIIQPSKLSILLRGEILLEGSLYAAVDPDECTWQVDTDVFGDKTLSVSLQKSEPTDEGKYWPCVLKADEKKQTMPRFGNTPVHGKNKA